MHHLKKLTNFNQFYCLLKWIGQIWSVRLAKEMLKILTVERYSKCPVIPISLIFFG